MRRGFHPRKIYFLKYVGQDLCQNPDFAAIINVEGQLLFVGIESNNNYRVRQGSPSVYSENVLHTG